MPSHLSNAEKITLNLLSLAAKRDSQEYVRMSGRHYCFKERVSNLWVI